MKKNALCAILLISSVTPLMVSAASVAPAPLTSIVGNWHMDEEKGQKLLDSSSYAKNARLGLAAGVDKADPTWTTRRFDTTALHFDGEDDVVVVPYAKNLEPEMMSVEAWVKGDNVQADRLQYIVSKSGLSCAVAAYALYTSEGGGLTFYVGDTKDDGRYIEAPNAGAEVWDGNWHHVVGTYDKTMVRLFVDGHEIGSGSDVAEDFAINYKSFPNKDLYIGDYDAGKICIATDPNIKGTYSNANFAGDIDEVRIWNRALTAEEVAVRALGD